ncbi:sugar transporter ERD6-like 6 isoform X1 [Colias croceus]|uniref:sugar transporter ERD6-like 6 isoform X1 n=2 Tax=Colias crocea TaxID=72248 RepID=UPI001E28090B|nr:sugar transporter ERD6-like 6 isoform X1 [Colias croceus]
MKRNSCFYYFATTTIFSRVSVVKMSVQTFRQVLVITGLALCSISDGYIFGQTSGMIDALRGNSTMQLSEDGLSWIASSINITCFCGFAVVAIVTEILGRRKALILLNIPVLCCWIMVYFAQNITTLLFSRVIMGVSYGGVLMLTYICVGEYASPNIRSLCLNLIGCVGTLIGSSLGHILSLLIPWREVALLGIIPTCLAIVIPCFWVESPFWLASKGRFDECTDAFKALHISTDVTKKELALIIANERRNQTKYSSNTHVLKLIITKVSIAIKERYFWKISILNTVINIYRIAGGRILFTTLALTILKDITGDSNILKHTILVDGFCILGALISCILVKKFKMRSLLFSSGILANIILIVLASVLYYRPVQDDIYVWIKVSLLALYFIIMIAGPYAVLETLLIEINPLDIKAFFIFFFGAIIGVAQFLAVKLMTNMVNLIGYHGIFFLNAIIIFICMTYIWYYLPETKGKSLEEIQCYFKNESVLEGVYENCEQCNVLLDSVKKKCPHII